jgi:hypothetical protein
VGGRLKWCGSTIHTSRRVACLWVDGNRDFFQCERAARLGLGNMLGPLQITGTSETCYRGSNRQRISRVFFGACLGDCHTSPLLVLGPPKDKKEKRMSPASPRVVRELSPL